jgi:hypothetical protein
MAEVLAQFADLVRSEDGIYFSAQACGAQNANGLWESWIEFTPVDGGARIHSGRETTQPNRTAAEYWASGLTPVYLEGALKRALQPRVVEPPPPKPKSAFPGPAPHTIVADAAPSRHQAVLDPFSVIEKGEPLLRQELAALSSWHLTNIIAAYELSDSSEAALNRLPRGALVDIIVSQTRERSTLSRKR